MGRSGAEQFSRKDKMVLQACLAKRPKDLQKSSEIAGAFDLGPATNVDNRKSFVRAKEMAEMVFGIQLVVEKDQIGTKPTEHVTYYMSGYVEEIITEIRADRNAEKTKTSTVKTADNQPEDALIVILLQVCYKCSKL